MPAGLTAGPLAALGKRRCWGEYWLLTLCACFLGRGLCFPLVKTCVFGHEPKASDEVPLASRTEPAETTPTWQALKLLFCAAGLQVGRQALPLFLGWAPGQVRCETKVFTLPAPRGLLAVLTWPPLPGGV